MPEVDLRQLLLLAGAFFVPLFLIKTHRNRWLLAWVCFTAGMNIFDTTVILNFSAGRVVGLLLIPQALRSLPWVARSKPGCAIIVQYICLILTGVVFGFLFPWSDGGLIRAFNHIAPGRTLIYLVRTAADISVSFFVARQVIQSRCSNEIIKYLLVGTSVAALGGILEFAFRIDLYHVITGATETLSDFRVRGLNFEPRGLGLIAAYGFFLAVLIQMRWRTWTKSWLVVLHGVALFISGSTSALIALVAGAFGLSMFDKRARTASIALFLLCILIAGLIFLSGNEYVEKYVEHSQLRLSTDRIDSIPTDLIQNLAFRMEIFDAPALLFLASNPIYLLSGTGPGLIPLPASAYLPPSIYFDWASETGINAPPTMGLLLEASNLGIIGLVLWFVICFSSFRSFSRLARYHPDERERWLRMRTAFMIGAAMYSVQNSPSSVIWPIFIGTGIAAAYLVRAERCLPNKTPLKVNE